MLPADRHRPLACQDRFEAFQRRGLRGVMHRGVCVPRSLHFVAVRCAFCDFNRTSVGNTESTEGKAEGEASTAPVAIRTESARRWRVRGRRVCRAVCPQAAFMRMVLRMGRHPIPVAFWCFNGS